MAYSCCLGLKGKLDFPDFLQKSFITSITDLQNFLRKHLLQNFEAEVFDLLLLSLLEALHVGLGRETVESELLRLHSRVTFFRTSFSNF